MNVRLGIIKSSYMFCFCSIWTFFCSSTLCAVQTATLSGGREQTSFTHFIMSKSFISTSTF